MRKYTYVGDKNVYFLLNNGTHVNMNHNVNTGMVDRRVIRKAGYSYFIQAGTRYPFWK